MTTDHLVTAERDKRNRTKVIVPEGAKPGDTLIVDRQVTPLRCVDCAKPFTEEGSVVVPGAHIIKRIAEEQQRAAEKQDMSKPAPAQPAPPAVAGSGIHL